MSGSAFFINFSAGGGSRHLLQLQALYECLGG
jgi:hypothetical protein